VILNIPDLLKPEQLAQARELLEKADWIDGKTSGHGS